MNSLLLLDYMPIFYIFMVAIFMALLAPTIFVRKIRDKSIVGLVMLGIFIIILLPRILGSATQIELLSITTAWIALILYSLALFAIYVLYKNMVNIGPFLRYLDALSKIAAVFLVYLLFTNVLQELKAFEEGRFILSQLLPYSTLLLVFLIILVLNFSDLLEIVKRMFKIVVARLGACQNTGAKNYSTLPYFAVAVSATILPLRRRFLKVLISFFVISVAIFVYTYLYGYYPTLLEATLLALISYLVLDLLV